MDYHYFSCALCMPNSTVNRYLSMIHTQRGRVPRAHCRNCSRLSYSEQLAAAVRTAVDGTVDPADLH